MKDTLRELRKTKGYTTKYVAEKCYISTHYLNRIETGNEKISKRLIKVLAEIYGATEKEIIEKQQKAIEIRNQR